LGGAKFGAYYGYDEENVETEIAKVQKEDGGPLGT
jgi:hypothetical protein